MLQCLKKNWSINSIEICTLIQLFRPSSKMVRIDKSGRCRQVFMTFGTKLGGRWSQLTGGRCSGVDLVLKMLGRDLEWSLLTGGCYSEVVVSTGLTVLPKTVKWLFTASKLDRDFLHRFLSLPYSYLQNPVLIICFWQLFNPCMDTETPVWFQYWDPKQAWATVEIIDQNHHHIFWFSRPRYPYLTTDTGTP